MKNFRRYLLPIFQLAAVLTIFLTASQAYAFRFVVYADSRAPKGDPAAFNQAILGYINSQIAELEPRPDFVVFIGDMVNRTLSADGSTNNLAYWKAFMEAGLGGIPIFVAVGNTDLYGNSGWTEFPMQAVYQATFNEMPSNGPPNYNKLAYFFEYGEGKERSLFAVLDSFGFYESQGTLQNFDNGFDSEQIAWFYQVSSGSEAHHKFAFSHGPAFSIEGFPVNDSVRVIWNLMEEFKYDMFYCGHEHIYSRWAINKKVYPLATRKLTQTIVGSAGATPDPLSRVKVNPEKAHIYSGYTYVVVDVKDRLVSQRSFAVVSNGLGGLTTKKIDCFKLIK
ncbi:metallophosphoesterase family protein [Candidatus Protochlamydia phocaeensis]|uniref:metallophosphoesterase family protein n=1 Tax=Candidatus Protochlamydia phocaeensis TaxID=1414722 RepID=UPI0008394033|nr:metallophosphoesterase [Candidatus Protochlamydia phocaeensis]